MNCPYYGYALAHPSVPFLLVRGHSCQCAIAQAAGVCTRCGFPKDRHRSERYAHHSECTLEEFTAGDHCLLEAVGLPIEWRDCPLVAVLRVDGAATHTQNKVPA